MPLNKTLPIANPMKTPTPRRIAPSGGRLFTDLSQVEADLVLARTLQEQERAYMMLTMDARESSDYGSWDADTHELEYEIDGNDYDDASEANYDGSDVELDDGDEDAFDVNAHAQELEEENHSGDLDPSAYSSDEAYARALQDAEDREMAARLLAMAGLNENMMLVGVDEDEEEEEEDDEDEHGGDSQDAWEDIDPDHLSYEELLALGDVVGTEGRGLSSDAIASLPSIKYKSEGTDEGGCDSCVICRLEYEDGDTLTALSCKHLYHPECINNWLKINKVCPVCSTEVSASGRT